MSRFSPVIGAPQTAGFTETAKVSQEGRNRSLDRDVETQKAIADIVNERNKVQLTKRAQDIESIRVAGELNNQISQMEYENAQATNELALKAEGIRTQLLSDREGRASAQGLQTQRLDFEGEQQKDSQEFTAGENVLNRSAQMGERLAGQEFTAGENVITRSAQTSERLAGQEFTSKEGGLERKSREDISRQDNESRIAVDAARRKADNAALSEGGALAAAEAAQMALDPKTVTENLKRPVSKADADAMQRQYIDRGYAEFANGLDDEGSLPVNTIESFFKGLGKENAKEVFSPEALVEIYKTVSGALPSDRAENSLAKATSKMSRQQIIGLTMASLGGNFAAIGVEGIGDLVYNIFTGAKGARLNKSAAKKLLNILRKESESRKPVEAIEVP